MIRTQRLNSCSWLVMFLGLSVSLGWSIPASGGAISENGQPSDQPKLNPQPVGPPTPVTPRPFSVSPQSGGPRFVVPGTGIVDVPRMSFGPTSEGTLAEQLEDGSWAFDAFFEIEFEVDYQIDNGALTPVVGTGTARTTGTAPPGDDPLDFNVEWLEFNLAFGPFLLRESPTLASLGFVTNTDLGDGFYLREGVHEILTEISIDGGQTWHPEVVIPEPATWVLMVLAIAATMFVRTRRKLSAFREQPGALKHA